MSNTYPQELAWQPATDKPTTVKPLKPLTRKENAFVQHRVNNPKASGTQSALATYATTSVNTAAQIASDNLRKPHIQAELAKYESKAEYNLMTLADKSTEYAITGTRDGAAYASVSERVNNSIIDRLRGKATQRTESVSTTVTLSLSLKDITTTTSDSTGQPSQEK